MSKNVVTSETDFKATTFFDVEYIRNDTRYDAHPQGGPHIEAAIPPQITLSRQCHYNAPMSHRLPVTFGGQRHSKSSRFAAQRLLLRQGLW